MPKHLPLPLVLSVVIILATPLVLLFRSHEPSTNNQQLPTGCYYQQVQCIRAPCNPILVCPTLTPNPNPTTHNSPPNTYTCPPSGWLDCLPGPGPAKPHCQKDYLSWIQSNCPDFSGVAY